MKWLRDAPKNVYQKIAIYDHFNEPLPEGLTREPELHGMELWLWEDFWILGASRQVYDGGVRPIPHNAISDYHASDRPFLCRAMFIDIIRSMDMCYIEPKDKG